MNHPHTGLSLAYLGYNKVYRFSMLSLSNVVSDVQSTGQCHASDLRLQEHITTSMLQILLIMTCCSKCTEEGLVEHYVECVKL